MRSIEARIAKLEEESTAVEQCIHVVLVPDGRKGDEAHNAAQRKKALEVNPAPEGAQVLFVTFVGIEPNDYPVGCDSDEEQIHEPPKVEAPPPGKTLDR